MTKERGKFHTTRLFSLQLANHDGLFAPRERRPRNFAWVKIAALALPALVVFTFPSFQIGRGLLKDPGLRVPETLRQGEIFTMPVGEDDETVPVVAGRALGFIDGKKPMYVGAALKPFDFEVTFDFNDGDDHRRLKALVPRAKHPTYPFFVKHVHVLADETLAVDQEAEKAKLAHSKDGAEKLKEKLKLIPPAIQGKEAKAFERFDGNMRLRCWKTPTVEPLGIDPLKPRRHPRLGSLGAAGSGEIVYSGANDNGDYTVVLYHGGGLYTRYWGIRELKTPKSGRVNAGQTLGYVHLAPPRHDTPATWQALMSGVGGPGEVKTQALLELSSQLCDSK